MLTPKYCEPTPIEVEEGCSDHVIFTSIFQQEVNSGNNVQETAIPLSTPLLPLLPVVLRLLALGLYITFCDESQETLVSAG